MVHLDSCNVLLHFSDGSTASSNPVSLEIQLMLDHVGSVCRFHLLSKLLRDFMLRKNNRQSLLGGAAVPPRFRMKWYSHSEYIGLKLPLTCCWSSPGVGRCSPSVSERWWSRASFPAWTLVNRHNDKRAPASVSASDDNGSLECLHCGHGSDWAFRGNVFKEESPSHPYFSSRSSAESPGEALLLTGLLTLRTTRRMD